MSIHPGRTAIAFFSIALLGATIGFALCALSVLLWMFLHAPVPSNTLLGCAITGLFVGVPVGGFVAPVLAFTLLRRIPIGRAVGYATVGAGVALLVAAFLPLMSFSSVAILALVGVSFGVMLARHGASSVRHLEAALENRRIVP